MKVLVWDPCRLGLLVTLTVAHMANPIAIPISYMNHMLGPKVNKTLSIVISIWYPEGPDTELLRT